jgi:hypothetical protein
MSLDASLSENSACAATADESESKVPMWNHLPDAGDLA